MFYVWDERQFAVKDNAQELSFLCDRNMGTVQQQDGLWMGFAQITEMYAYGFRGRELESIGVSPVCKFIETLLEVTLDNMDMLRSVADQKIVDI